MNIKQFFNPTWEKVIFTIILFAVICFIPYSSFTGPDASFSGKGFPFPIYGSASTIAGPQPTEIIFWGIILNLIIIFIISCLIIFLYNKLRKNKK